MNYEEFSLEAQKVIDQFRSLIENIKSGKDKSKIKYGRIFTLPHLTYPSPTEMSVAVYAFGFIARLSPKTIYDIQSFFLEKNYFLPKFSSEEDYEQNKHKYPYIKE